MLDPVTIALIVSSAYAAISDVMPFLNCPANGVAHGLYLAFQSFALSERAMLPPAQAPAPPVPGPGPVPGPVPVS